MIIDMHMHIFPAYAGSPDHRGNVSLGYGLVRQGDRIVQGLPPSFERTSSPPEVALGYMDWCGVEKALLSQGPWYGLHDDAVVQAVYRWPERFYGLAMYNPARARRMADDLQRLMEDGGLIGVKLEMESTRRVWPEVSLLGADEMRVWERCAALNGLLVLHLEPGAQQCTAIERLVEALPTLRVLLCHLGLVPEEGWQDQVRLARHPNIYLDVAAVPFAFREQEEYPCPSAQEAIRWAVAEVGAHKIVWGSDYPGTLVHATYRQLLNVVRTQCPTLSEQERSLILGGTAERLLAQVGLR